MNVVRSSSAASCDLGTHTVEAALRQTGSSAPWWGPGFAEFVAINKFDRKGALDALRDVLGVPDLDTELLTHALTHRSYAYEHPGEVHNERLEFLGDAVLQLAVTDEIYHRYPEWDEGRLAKLRASVVSARALAGVARSLGLGPHIRLGKGEEATGHRGSVLRLGNARGNIESTRYQRSCKGASTSTRS